jgi:outer membrane protein TolC
MTSVVIMKFSANVGWIVLLTARVAAAEPIDERPLERAEVQRAVLAHHPAVTAAESRARAARAEVDAAGHLPAPEAMAQIWQIPFDKPYAIDRAGMIMIGLSQRFPAPGSLGAREDARKSEATLAETRVSAEERAVARAVGHAYVDYAEATERRAIHANHEHLERRLVDLSRARHAAGGMLAESVRAEAELARAQSELASDATMERTARAQLNVLLGHALDGALGAPRTQDAVGPAEPVETLIARATANRPEPKAAAAESAAMRSELEATRTEARVPSFALSALYFPPSGAMTVHSYGVGASVDLPWLWGGASARARAQEAQANAADAAQRASHLPIAVEVVASHAAVARAGERLRVLQQAALPAGKRAVDVSVAGYESNAVPLAAVLEAQRSVIEVEMAVVDARAALAHALVDLEAAVGGSVPTRPLANSPSEELHHGK